MSGVRLLVCSDERQAALPQRGETFGERLSNAFDDARRLGYRQIVAVGTDSPGLGRRHLEAAFARLTTHDVVLGRASDGGVYLIGTRSEPAPLLRGVPWRTGRVCARLAANAGGEPAYLDDRLADVDAHRDLPRLRHDPTLEPATTLLIERLLARAPHGRADQRSAPPRHRSLPRLSLRGPPVSPVIPSIV